MTPSRLLEIASEVESRHPAVAAELRIEAANQTGASAKLRYIVIARAHDAAEPFRSRRIGTCWGGCASFEEFDALLGVLEEKFSELGV